MADYDEAQARKTPQAEALVFAGRLKRRMTYQELNERANRLANKMKYAGMEPGTVIGVCLERSPDMIIGLLAILKAGGIYVPLDPDYPNDRLKFILEDARIEVILTHDRTEEKIRPILSDEITIINLNRDKKTIGRRSKKNPKRWTSTSDTAYVIYTS